MDNSPITGPTWLCGDVHGLWQRFIAAVDAAGLREANIILLGDCGVGLGRREPDACFRWLDAELRARHCRAWLIRGNHDNPAFWRSPLRGEIEAQWHSIRMLVQGGVDINGSSYYVYPGAVSLDRRLRYEHTEWFRDERLQPAAPAFGSRPCCGILGHTGPRPEGFVEPGFDYEACHADKRLADDIREEEALVADAIAQLRAHNARLGCDMPLRYYHGHFHASWETECPQLRSRCLAIDELIALPQG